MISLRYSDPPQTDKEVAASKGSSQKPLDNFDITDYVSGVTWSGDEDQAARKLEFTIIYNTADKDTTFVQLDLKLGGYVYMFYRETETADEVELFQGRIFFRKRATDSYTFEFTAYDDMIYLAKSNIRAIVKGTAEDAIKNVCAEVGIKTDVMPSMPTEVNFVADDKSATEVIQMVLEQVRAATGDEYTTLALEGAVNIIKKDELVSYVASNQTNVTGAEHSESLEDMVDRVKSVDDNGTVCQMFSINDDIKKYGTIQKIYKMKPPKEGETVDNVVGAKALLKEIKNESSLKAVGDINCIAGYALTVQEEQLKGKFHIKADSHTFNGNVHMMTLTLQYLPDTPETPEVEQVEYAKPVFNSSSKRMKKKRGTGNGDAAVDAGLNTGWDTWGGQTMANGRNGCAEFVGKCGSYYSPFLADECNNGVVYVPTMVQDADANGLLQGFDENNLEKGDVIVYGDDDHVVIYDGQGGYYGNSSSRNVTVHGGDYTEMGMTPTKIIKASKG